MERSESPGLRVRPAFPAKTKRPKFPTRSETDRGRQKTPPLPRSKTPALGLELPPASDIQMPMSAFRPITSALAPKADVADDSH